MILKAEGISRDFLRRSRESNVFTAVKETDFLLPEGTLSVITGRSGSGKSTFLNMLSGLLEPTKGRVLAGEQDLYLLEDAERSALRNRAFGFIPQGQSAIRSLTVLENILLPFTLYGKEPDENRAADLMELLGIGQLRDVMPRELSGGEMRRMAIVRALVHRPQVIFADEPTGDLDDENTEIVFQSLRRAAREAGTSVLLVTHEAAAESYADEMYRMSEGVLTPEKIRRETEETFHNSQV